MQVSLHVKLDNHYFQNDQNIPDVTTTKISSLKLQQIGEGAYTCIAINDEGKETATIRVERISIIDNIAKNITWRKVRNLFCSH